jgi:hypothetical protein
VAIADPPALAQPARIDAQSRSIQASIDASCHAGGPFNPAVIPVRNLPRKTGSVPRGLSTPAGRRYVAGERLGSPGAGRPGVRRDSCCWPELKIVIPRACREKKPQETMTEPFVSTGRRSNAAPARAGAPVCAIGDLWAGSAGEKRARPVECPIGEQTEPFVECDIGGGRVGNGQIINRPRLDLEADFAK